MKKNNAPYYALLIISLIIISFDGIIFKTAAKHDLLSKQFFMYYAIAVCIYIIYAFLWQIILKRIDLYFAYSFRSIIVVLGLIWSSVILGEQITKFNIAGAILIMLGIFLIARNREQANE